MAKQASSAGQILSVPNGGGALQGIGEKFAPDLHTGTGNYSVSLDLPSGRNGFQPQLAIAYSTGSGNGPFGLGWRIGVPGVSRKTSAGVPRYDERDTYILSGAEDLVRVGGTKNAARFRPRTEGLFARITHLRDATTDYWEVRSKDGLVSVYGTPGAAGQDRAVVADPSERSNVFAWRLTETRDPFGNRIVYDYLADAGADGAHRWEQPLLARVRYVDLAAQGPLQFLVSVTLSYEERPDPFSES